MVLPVLVFFGSALTGAILSQRFASDRARTGPQLIGVIAYGLAFEFLAFSIPFCSAWLEFFFVLAGTAGFGMIMWVLGIGHQPEPPGPVTGGGCLIAVIIPLLPVVLFTTVGRVAHARKMAEEIEGIITLRYRSGNHNAPSIAVARDDGSAMTVEGVDEAMWNAVFPGRSRLKKPAWSAAGELDGKVMRVVPRGYVMFLGPFRD